MRVTSLLLPLLLHPFLTTAWSKEDHEIFRLQDELQSHEGPNTTFYTFLAVPPTASPADINKAYRTLSRRLHPDKARSNWIANYNKPPPSNAKPASGAKPTTHVHKNKQPSTSEINKFNKEASARFERLSLVAAILRGSERKRYDHFLYNGFPRWKGTGYYYERYRPGFGTVLIGLFVFVGGAGHYAALYVTWRRQKEFGERYVKHARKMAWGDEGGVGSIPGLGGETEPKSYQPQSQSQSQSQEDESVQWNRKQKRMMEKEKRKENRGPIKSVKAVKKAREEGISTPQEPEVTSGPVGAKKRTRAENGKILIVDSVGNVFLEEETAEGDVQEFLLDPAEIPPPSLSDTFLVRGPLYLYALTAGRYLSAPSPEQIAHEANEQNEPSDASSQQPNGQQNGVKGVRGQSQSEMSEAEQLLQSFAPVNPEAESRKRRARHQAREM